MSIIHRVGIVSRLTPPGVRLLKTRGRTHTAGSTLSHFAANQQPPDSLGEDGQLGHRFHLASDGHTYTPKQAAVHRTGFGNRKRKTDIMDETATQADRFRGCLVGLATGDAVGTTLEFRNRGHFEPIDDMVGGGPFSLNPGEWTDDTSMALCLAASLVEKQGMDLADQLRKYNLWFSEGYMSSNGTCFDIGNQTRKSLGRFAATGGVYDMGSGQMSEGNGSLMRLAPVPMFYLRNKSKAIEMAAESSRTTHGAKNCLDCCKVFAEILIKALEGAPKEEILSPFPDIPPAYSDEVKSIMRMEFLEYSDRRIWGTGHVIRCLEAALWCFHHTDNFRDAILKAANLGNDADTTAAVCGQIAGAFYGETGIPASWLEKLAFRSMIEELADNVGKAADECQ